MNLKPCPYRQVDDEGHILCDKIKSGDREVSPNICRACPVAAINCTHLRATLDHQARPPITVRYGNGTTEVWDDPAPAIALERAACAVKVTPIHSPRDCAGCPLRAALVAPEAIQMPDRRPQTGVARAPRVTATSAPLVQPGARAASMPAASVAQPAAAPPADARANRVHQKIIQLQEWLAHQKTAAPKKPEAESSVLPLAVGQRASMPRGEEKRVGWTD